MNLYKMPEQQVLLFALILLRIIAFVVSSAVLGSQNISVTVKILLSISLAIILYPLVLQNEKNIYLISDNVISYAFREVLLGLCLGFLTRLFFFTLSMTGELISVSMGLSAAQLFNPVMGSNGNVMEQFFSVIGALIFFALGGHHILIGSLFESFQLIPTVSLGFNFGPLGEIVGFAQELFLLTIKMCAPVVVAILATNIAMGILGRAVPQINVLVSSMPITILLGLLITIVCLPLLVLEMNGLLDVTTDKLMTVMKHL